MARAFSRDWAIGGAGLVGALLLLLFGRGSTRPLAEGAKRDRMNIVITVVPADADNLACRGSFRLEGTRCRFDNDTDRPVQIAAPLRPFMTLTRELRLLSGVFEDPIVAAWLARSRAAGSQERATLDCDVVPVGVASTAEIRWVAGAAWSPERDISAARVVSCQVR